MTKATIPLLVAATFVTGGGLYLHRTSSGSAELRRAAAHARKLADEEHAGKNWEWPGAFADASSEARWRIESVCFKEGGRRPRVVGPDGVIRSQSCLVDAAAWLDDGAEVLDDRRASSWLALAFAVPCLGLALFVGRRQRARTRALLEAGDS
ncbi:MAG: hypothetical protein IPM35_31720 [Myxococcales bacterium]|nr:hypothetical protein [Myxococcales bacterium]